MSKPAGDKRPCAECGFPEYPSHHDPKMPQWEDHRYRPDIRYPPDWVPPAARVEQDMEGYWEKAYWRVVPKLQAAIGTLDVDRLARAMEAETGVAWPASWRDSDFAWVARQVAGRYRALSGGR